MPKWLILADDLTGAADTAGAFRRMGYRTLLQLSPELPEEPFDVMAWDADLRESSEGDAAIQAKKEDAAKLINSVDQVYLKIDSVLRGPIALLHRSLVQVLHSVGDTIERRGSYSLVCPAFPAQGRITRSGVQYVHGLPVARQGRKEPLRLVELFSGEHLAPIEIRPSSLPDTLLHLPSDTHSVVIVDAESDEDLEEIVRAVEDFPPSLWVGSAGLASAWARVHPGETAAPSLPHVTRVTVVCGTAHPVTLPQIEHLRLRGPNTRVFQSPTEREVKLRTSHAQNVIQSALTEAEALRMGWVLTGGWTARRFLEAMEVRSLEVGGEALPGVPWMIAREGRLKGCPILTKSGGFGSPDALEQGVRFLHAES